MSTGSVEPKKAPRGTGAPGPFTEEEVAQATQGPAGAPEIEEAEPAEIEERSADEAEPFEELAVKSKRLNRERIRDVVESILFVADKPQNIDQLFEATGIDRAK